MGEGAWSAMPTQRRSAIVATIVNIQSWGDALFNEPTPLADFARLTQPVLLMSGRQSPPSARVVTQLLAARLPNVERESIDGVGHMAPVTHPERVNAAIAAFVERHAAVTRTR